jgi:hypothetical protein
VTVPVIPCVNTAPPSVAAGALTAQQRRRPRGDQA